MICSFSFCDRTLHLYVVVFAMENATEKSGHARKAHSRHFVQRGAELLFPMFRNHGNSRTGKVLGRQVAAEPGSTDVVYK